MPLRSAGTNWSYELSTLELQPEDDGSVKPIFVFSRGLSASPANELLNCMGKAPKGIVFWAWLAKGRTKDNRIPAQTRLDFKIVRIMGLEVWV